MKKIFSLIILVSAMLMTNVACQEFQLDEHMESCYMLVNGGEWNKKDSTTRRAHLIIGIKGLNEDEYTIEYTVDGNPGIGKYALQKPDQDASQWTYNSQNFTGDILSNWDNIGKPRLTEGEFSDEYDGNFPSGSKTTFHYLYTGVNRHPSSGSTHFLSPKLEPGKHVIKYTITNSYGDILTNEREVIIKDKPGEKD